MQQRFLVTIRANWHTMSQQITSLKNSYNQSVCMSACAIPQICFWIFRRLQNSTINRPLWTQQLSCAFCRLAHSLFSSSQFSLFFLFFLLRLTGCHHIFSQLPLPILQPLTLTLTLPRLCHWDESGRDTIPSASPTLLQGRILPVSSVFRLWEYTLLFLPDFNTFSFSADQYLGWKTLLLAEQQCGMGMCIHSMITGVTSSVH